MSSRAADADSNRKVDPDNRLLWHFPVTRMEAEVVRDSLLHTAGELELTMFGPEIPHSQGLSSRRRSLYFAHHGESRMEFLDLFDAANPCDAYRRTTSVLPQQALALSNSELSLRHGRILARKLSQEAATESEFILAAFEQVLGRAATPAEQRASVAFLGRQLSLFQGSPSELQTGSADPDGPSTNPLLRARENLVHALFNHNEFISIR